MTCRPGWERRAKALARFRTRHIKNARLVRRTSKTLHGGHPNLFLIHTFFTLLITLLVLLPSLLFLLTITLVKCPVRLYSTFYLFLFFS